MDCACDGGRRVSSLIAFLAWWIRVLVNALLRPMFCRYRQLRRDGNSERQTRQADRYETLFYRMLDACDCYPFAVIVDECGLWFVDPAEQRDIIDQWVVEAAG